MTCQCPAVSTGAVQGRQNTSSKQLTTKYGRPWPALKWSATLLLWLSCSNSPVKIVPRSFDSIKHIERSPIRLSLFYYDTTYLLYTYNQSSHSHHRRMRARSSSQSTSFVWGMSHTWIINVFVTRSCHASCVKWLFSGCLDIQKKIIPLHSQSRESESTLSQLKLSIYYRSWNCRSG